MKRRRNYFAKARHAKYQKKKAFGERKFNLSSGSWLSFFGVDARKNLLLVFIHDLDLFKGQKQQST
jgi:hypothetical protein